MADRILGDVVRSGWPVGQLLGSEPELLEQHGVSRAVFREAIRLLEHQQVVRTRRGPGGGLVVTEPTVEAVMDAVVLYLHRVGASVDDVFEARLVLEDIVVQLAASRLNTDGRTQLRQLLEAEASGSHRDPRALHLCLAHLTGNSALELFVGVLSRVASLYARDWQALVPTHGGQITTAHRGVVAAVTAGDGELARSRMSRHLRAEGEFLRRRHSTQRFLPDSVVLERHAPKRAAAVAGEVARMILAEDLQSEALVGSELDLMDRLGVSRDVLREAVRILEHHHLASMRRGPRGGLIVMDASPMAVTDIVAIYLARHGVGMADLSEIRIGVELALVELAIQRQDGTTNDRLHAALARERAAPADQRPEMVHDLHATVASMAQSCVLELVALVVIRLSDIHQIANLPLSRREEVRTEVMSIHERIAAAIAAGELDLARHRMRNHLDALAAFVA